MRWLPPDSRAFKDAPPGDYRLHSTGEVLILVSLAVGSSLAAHVRMTGRQPPAPPSRN